MKQSITISRGLDDKTKRAVIPLLRCLTKNFLKMRIAASPDRFDQKTVWFSFVMHINAALLLLALNNFNGDIRPQCIQRIETQGQLINPDGFFGIPFCRIVDTAGDD